MKTARCNAMKCQAPVIWALTVNEKKIPIDAGIDPSGTFILEDRGVEPPRALYVPPAERAWKNMHTPHHATCAERASFVRKAEAR